MTDAETYTERLKQVYSLSANEWTIDNRDPVVGSFDRHNLWEDYQIYLFGNLPTEGKLALDFGCGVGRNIVLFKDRFFRIDGADVAENILDKAKEYLSHSNVPIPNLYVTNKVGLPGIADNTYDIVFSTICLQHINMHSVRKSIFIDMFRVLQPGGYLCIQMGFGGKGSPIQPLS